MKPNIGIIVAVLLMIAFAVILDHPAAYLAAFIWFVGGAILSLAGDGRSEAAEPDSKPAKVHNGRFRHV